MKNILLKSFALATVAASVLGTSGTVFAADAESATTPATISFETGGMNLSNVTSTTSFGKLSIADVWTKGAEVNADTNLTATVDDFRGTTAGWTLNVTANGWTAGSDGTDAGVAALTSSKLSLDDANGSELAQGTSVLVQTGEEGSTDITARALHLSIPTATKVGTGSYTNTLNWDLADTAALTNAK